MFVKDEKKAGNPKNNRKRYNWHLPRQRLRQYLYEELMENCTETMNWGCSLVDFEFCQEGFILGVINIFFLCFCYGGQIKTDIQCLSSR